MEEKKTKEQQNKNQKWEPWKYWKHKKHWKPKTLVISGGGLKGIGYVGALKALFENGVRYKKIKTLCGSSVGSLIVTGLVLGYSVDEMKEAMNETGDMLPKAIPLLFGDNNQKILPLLTDYYSISDGKLWDSHLKTLILKKGYNPDELTFEDLYNETKKTLVISASNITMRRPEYFSRRTTPKMLVYDAIRISCRIPMLFPVIRMNNNIYADGDIYDSFPVKGAKKKTIMKMKEGDMIGIVNSGQEKSHQIENFFDYLYQIFRGVTTRYSYICSQEYSEYLINLHCDFSTTLEMNHENREILFQRGYQEGLKYLERRGKPYKTLRPTKEVVNGP